MSVGAGAWLKWYNKGHVQTLALRDHPPPRPQPKKEKEIKEE
jgi:hypothetical protein